MYLIFPQIYITFQKLLLFHFRYTEALLAQEAVASQLDCNFLKVKGKILCVVVEIKFELSYVYLNVFL